MGKAKRTAGKAAAADKRATHKAAARPDGTLLRAAGKASEVADQPPLIALSAATILVGAALRRPVVWRSGVRMLTAHLVATGMKTVLKSAIDRTRPSRALKQGHRVSKGKGTGDTTLNSFPSGHTAGAVAVAQAVAAEAPVAALPLQAAAAGVAALQPSRGQHYWSDVAAGAAIGWLAERLTNAGWAAAESGWARLRRDRARGAAAGSR